MPSSPAHLKTPRFGCASIQTTPMRSCPLRNLISSLPIPKKKSLELGSNKAPNTNLTGPSFPFLTKSLSHPPTPRTGQETPSTISSPPSFRPTISSPRPKPPPFAGSAAFALTSPDSLRTRHNSTPFNLISNHPLPRLTKKLSTLSSPPSNTPST